MDRGWADFRIRHLGVDHGSEILSRLANTCNEKGMTTIAHTDECISVILLNLTKRLQHRPELIADLRLLRSAKGIPPLLQLISLNQLHVDKHVFPLDAPTVYFWNRHCMS